MQSSPHQFYLVLVSVEHDHDHFLLLRFRHRRQRKMQPIFHGLCHCLVLVLKLQLHPRHQQPCRQVVPNRELELGREQSSSLEGQANTKT